MVRSLLAAWHVSLRRTRADWPVVVAAWVIVLLAAALFAAEPMYSSAASLAGLRRTLAEASVAETTIQVSLYCDPAQVGPDDATVRAELAAAIAPLSGTIVRDIRDSATLDLPAGPAIAPGDQAILGSLDGLADHATLVEGSWPVSPGTASAAMPVVVVDAVARDLGLHVRDEVQLVGHRFGEPFTVPVQVVGIFAIRAASDPYWHGDEQLIGGIQSSGASRTIGPFLTDPTDLLALPGHDTVHVRWRVYPSLEQIAVGGTGSLARGVEALPGRLMSSVGSGAFVTTGLTQLLADSERSLLVSRTEVLLLMLQLAVMAGYAILLAASLLGEHRRIDIALLRSRGAGSTHVALLALAEGLLIALPAVLLGPWLALAGLSVLDRVGPLADAGAGLTPSVTGEAYAFAAAAGLVCLVLLVIPAVLSARALAVEQRDVSRGETRTLGQRVGLDVALVAVAIIALWQLRLYGAPLTQMVQGRLGIDPLLVAAPAVGLLSGGILALRILPGMARGAEVVISRGRNLVGSLGTRQLARRPLRYTRSALLVMLALSMGVFSVSYAATWSSSQRDQAEYQAGAAVRVTPDRSAHALPTWSLPAAYAALPGAGPLSPVERGLSVRVGRGSADLLAIDAAVAPEIVLFRADEATSSLQELMQGLRAGRPDAGLISLPNGVAALRIVPLVHLASVNRISVDESPEPLDPASIDVHVSINAVVRDARGLLYRVNAGPVRLQGPKTAVVLSLTPTAAPADGGAVQVAGRLDGPIELAGLGVSVQIPDNTVSVDGTVGIAAVAAAQTTGGPWTELPLNSSGAWQATLADGGPNVAVPAVQVNGTSVQLGGNGPGAIAVIGGTSSWLSLTPAALGSLIDAPLPVIANRAFLASVSAAPGDTLTATMLGGPRQLKIVGVVDAFPATDPDGPLLVVDEPTLGLLRLETTGLIRAPDEWWLGAAGGASDGLAALLRASPFDSASVVTASGRTASLRADPIALGITGALILGFVASSLFAVVGLMLSAGIAARERRTEFALLRALGLSGRQLSAWLWLENGSLVVVSLLAGTGLGLVVGWLVLPFIAVTQQATAPVPPVIVQVPWDQVVALDLLSALALGAAVAITGRLLRQSGVGSVLRMGED